MPSIAQRQSAPTPVSDTVPLPTKVPELPEDVFARFPSLRTWQESENQWWTKTYQALQNQNNIISQTTSSTQQNARTLRLTFNQFRAEVTEEIDAIVDATGAMAKRIVTVSAMAGINTNIKVQAAAPGAPGVGDYWLDTSDITLVITYQWDGLSWVEVTDPIAFAGVADERTARVTADGYLEGKYTLIVTAGTVITGVNITSASGSGTNISNVAWTADQFQIYSGTSKKTMFVADAVQDKVRMASTFTVDGSTSSIYVKTTAGAGSYNSAGTPWFVDSLGRMSLGTGLTFDGTNLTVSGSVTASSGTIGGWTISSTTLSKNNAILDSAGQLVLGTSNDVVYLSATDATYRVWIGNATAGSAAFRVTKDGTMTATNGIFSGTISSTSGSIGGFTLGGSALTGTNITINATGGSGIIVGPSISDCALIAYAGLFDGIYKFASGTQMWALKTSGGAGHIIVDDSFGVQAIVLAGSSGTVTASTFSGSGASLTSLNGSNISSGTVSAARLGSGTTNSTTILRGDSTWQTYASSAFTDATNASNISSGTLSNSRLPSAISVTSLATANFQASVGTAVDFISVNFRGFNGGTQTFRVDYTTGEVYIQSVRVLTTRQPAPTTLGDVIAAGQAHGLWS